MDRVEKAFAPAFETLVGACESLEEFHVFCQEFYKDRPAEGSIITDPDTGEYIYKVKYNHPLPAKANRKALEALAHGRHCLDQAAYACRELTIGHKSKEENFPWARSENDLRFRLRSGMDKRLWPVFFDLKPYPITERETGGLDRIRALSILTNNKHTTGLIFAPQPSRWVTPTFIKHTGAQLQQYGPHDYWDVEKSEGLMMRWRGRVDIIGKPSLGISVVIADKRMPGWHPAWESIDEFLVWSERALKLIKSACYTIFDGESEVPRASSVMPENKFVKFSDDMISVFCQSCDVLVNLANARQVVIERNRHYNCVECQNRLLTIRPYLEPSVIVHRPGYRIGEWIFDNPTDAFIDVGPAGFRMPGGGNVLRSFPS